MTSKPTLIPLDLTSFAWAILMMIVSLVSPIASATDTAANNRAAYQAFTDAPSKESKQVLQQYLIAHEMRPIEDWTPEFEQLILEGHPLALEVVFESIPYTDGALSLHRDGLIGKSILTAPEAFLWGVTRFRSTIVRMGVLVGYLGTDYVDNNPASIRALEDRYLSLRNVENQNYNEARDEALLLLSERIYKRRQIMAQEVAFEGIPYTDGALSLHRDGPSLDPVYEGE